MSSDSSTPPALKLTRPGVPPTSRLGAQLSGSAGSRWGRLRERVWPVPAGREGHFPLSLYLILTTSPPPLLVRTRVSPVESSLPVKVPATGTFAPYAARKTARLAQTTVYPFPGSNVPGAKVKSIPWEKNQPETSQTVGASFKTSTNSRPEDAPGGL